MSPRTVAATYDLLGNFLEDKLNSHVEAREHNSVNEITLRSVAGPAGGADPGAALYLDETFGGSESPPANWDLIAGSFSEGNQAVSGTPATDTAVPWTPQAKSLMLVKRLTRLTDIAVSASVTFPSGGGYAGLVFGYQDGGSDYFVCLLKCVLGTGDQVGIYHVNNGAWTPVAGPTNVSGVEPQAASTLAVLVQGQYASISVDGNCVFSASSLQVLPGRVGILAGQSDISFDDVQVSRVDWPAPATPAWQVYRGTFSLSGGTAALAPAAGDAMNLAVREGTRGKNYDIEAQLGGMFSGIAFHVQDKLNYYYATQCEFVFYYLAVYRVRNGQPELLTANSLMPETSETPRHLHIKTSDDNVGIWVYLDGTWQMIVNPDEEGDGGGKNALTGSPGGLVGLTTYAIDTATCNLLKVGSTTGHVMDTANQAWVNETFASSVVPGYDAAGNMTSDGLYRYTYDAWNRLIGVRRMGPTGTPQTIATYRYDGLGHRVYKKVENSGNLDREEYFYYNNTWQLLEVDNASGLARQQFVWGPNYIDEAICMDVDTDTEGTGYGDCTDAGSRHFFYGQDANWNVTALLEEVGDEAKVIERYEYDPYGAVRIYRGHDPSAGREVLSVVSNSAVGNPLGFASLYRDEETGLYQTGTAAYSPALERPLQPVTRLVPNAYSSESMATGPQGAEPGTDPAHWPRTAPRSPIDPLPGPEWNPNYKPTPVEIPAPPWWLLPLLTIKGAFFGILTAPLMLIPGDNGPQPLPDIGPFEPTPDLTPDPQPAPEPDTQPKRSPQSQPCKKCKPCNPAEGKIAVKRVDLPPSKPHGGIPAPHAHLVEVNQDKKTCICYWNNAHPDVIAGTGAGLLGPPPPQQTGGGFED